MSIGQNEFAGSGYVGKIQYYSDKKFCRFDLIIPREKNNKSRDSFTCSLTDAAAQEFHTTIKQGDIVEVFGRLQNNKANGNHYITIRLQAFTKHKP